ncbi:MAG: hypothetical protein OXC99_06090 [Chloroflexi bacterium]|nr:hypothetical protein [Chloroflexota bacterium]
MEIDTLRSEMAEWPVQWRWEGTSGHPRRITDNFMQALEDEGFTVDLADVPITQGPVGNVGEFEGALVARWKQPSLSALKRKWFAAAVGLVLVPIIVGIFMIKYALEGRRHVVGLDWRGEAYSTTARAGQVNFGAERTGIVTDVRVTMRGAVLDAGRRVNDLTNLQPKLDRMQFKLSHSLTNLTMPTPMAPGAGPDGGTVDGAFTPAPPQLEDAAPPPALDEGRTNG